MANIYERSAGVIPFTAAHEWLTGALAPRYERPPVVHLYPYRERMATTDRTVARVTN
jgi:hypothetical protein